MSLRKLLLTLAIGVILLGACAAPTAPPAPAERPAPTPTRPETVTFPNGNLEAAVMDALGKPQPSRLRTNVGSDCHLCERFEHTGRDIRIRMPVDCDKLS